MDPVLKKGSENKPVTDLQELLNQRGYPVEIDGIFGDQTRRAVRAFQSQNLNKHGQPLVVDGIVGPLTWWSLRNPKKAIIVRSAIDYMKMPLKLMGGSKWGRIALKAAIGEIKAGAREIGGNNRGRWVLKYLKGLAPEGSSWCAGFVSWCFSQTKDGMPFKYCVGARNILGQFKKKGWSYKSENVYEPSPGDVVVCWRERLAGWKGHIGLVHHFQDGILYTIDREQEPTGSGV